MLTIVLDSRSQQIDIREEISYTPEEARALAKQLERVADDLEEASYRATHPNCTSEFHFLCTCCECNGHQVIVETGKCQFCKLPESECV